MKPHLTRLIDQMKSSSQSVKSLHSSLSNIEMESRMEPLGGTERTLYDIIEKLGAFQHQMNALSNEPESKWILVPVQHTINIIDSNGRLFRMIDELSTLLRSDKYSYDKGTGVIIFSESGATYNLAQTMQQIENHLDAAVMSAEPASSIVLTRSFGSSPREEGLLSEAIQIATSNLEKIKEILKNISKAESRITNKETAIIKIQSDSEKSYDEIKLAASEAIPQLATIASSLETATSLTAKIETAASIASSTKPQLESFKELLSEREEEITKGRKDLQEVRSDLNNEMNNLRNTRMEANKVLSYATTAGLSGAYVTEKEGLDKKLKQASIGFYISLFILSLLALIALSPFPKLTEWINFGPAVEAISTNHTSESDASTIAHAAAGIFVRLAVLIPGLMLVGFTARRHAALFRLREQHAYKWSIAMSVDGFKAQAPKYEEELTAAAFQELLFNPADRMDPPRSLRTNGLLSRLITPIVDATIKRMTEEKKKG